MITCPACLAAIAAGAAVCTACIVPGPAPRPHYPATGQPVVSAASQPFAWIGDIPPHMPDGGFDAPPAAWAVVGTDSATRTGTASTGRDLYPGEPLISYGYNMLPVTGWPREQAARIVRETRQAITHTPAQDPPTRWPWEPAPLR
jgi:hypothetical protein